MGSNAGKQTKQMGVFGIIGIMLASSLTVMVGNAITPALGVVATAILFGKLIDKKGPYPAAVFGLLFYGIFGVAGAFMPNAVSIFVDRFFLGAATAAIMSATVALISVFFQGEKQLRMISVQGNSHGVRRGDFFKCKRYAGRLFLAVSFFHLWAGISGASDAGAVCSEVRADYGGRYGAEGG